MFHNSFENDPTPDPNRRRNRAEMVANAAVVFGIAIADIHISSMISDPHATLRASSVVLHDGAFGPESATVTAQFHSEEPVRIDDVMDMTRESLIFGTLSGYQRPQIPGYQETTCEAPHGLPDNAATTSLEILCYIEYK